VGRHSAPGDNDDDVDVPLAELGTRGDLQLLRDNPGVRARCIAGACVPFALYTIAMIAIGRAGDFGVWVWIPIVVAGVFVGLFLDLGYRSVRRPDDGGDDSPHGRHAGHDAASGQPAGPSPPGQPGLSGKSGAAGV
jgi:hypothetical protein